MASDRLPSFASLLCDNALAVHTAAGTEGAAARTLEANKWLLALSESNEAADLCLALLRSPDAQRLPEPALLIAVGIVAEAMRNAEVCAANQLCAISYDRFVSVGVCVVRESYLQLVYLHFPTHGAHATLAATAAPKACLHLASLRNSPSLLSKCLARYCRPRRISSAILETCLAHSFTHNPKHACSSAQSCMFRSPRLWVFQAAPRT
eukprot:6180431-Pleurochrysis_carterae.AAC.3